MTYGANNLNLYLDGELIIAPGIGNPQAAQPLLLGAWVRNSTLTDFFQGLIQEVRIWDVVRTQEQIQATLNQRLSGIGGNLVGYWWFSADMLNARADPNMPDSEPSPVVKRLLTAEQSLGPPLEDYII
jgi:Concanavalin A-like lectin/glucanases superfamily